MQDLDEILGQIELAIDYEQFDDVFLLLHEITVRYPNCIDAYFLLGKARHRIGEIDAALEAYNKCIELEPTYYQAYINRGNIQRSLEKYEEAIENYSFVIEKCASPEVYMNRGVSKYFSGDFTGAIADYNKIFELEPQAENWDFLYFNRGLAKYDSGDKTGAKQDYDKALEINPEGNYVYYDIR